MPQNYRKSKGSSNNAASIKEYDVFSHNVFTGQDENAEKKDKSHSTERDVTICNVINGIKYIVKTQSKLESLPIKFQYQP